MHHEVVPSDRVEHVTVYGRDGTKLGTIERLMLDKVSGMVAYAVRRAVEQPPPLSGSVGRAQI